MASCENYEEFIYKLASKIKKLRRARGLTQEDMVQYGFNYRHYQKIESGGHSPSLSSVYRLAVAFDVEVTDLFTRD